MVALRGLACLLIILLAMSLNTKISYIKVLSVFESKRTENLVSFEYLPTRIILISSS